MTLRLSAEERIILAKLIGASVWEVQLYEHLDTHEGRERGRLAQYQQAATDSDSPAFRYLASLIVEDEIRHHRIFRDLASALQTEAELRPDEPTIPRLEGWGAEPQRVVELSERLLAEERADAEELHRLAGELKDLKDTTLWLLLVELMEMDTAKHIEILEFVRRHASTAAAS
jgi:rubrerythrin